MTSRARATNHFNAPSTALSVTETALLRVGQYLQRKGYRFTTITPASHARILARPSHVPPDGKNRDEMTLLRDTFGWSKPFKKYDFSSELFTRLAQAGALECLNPTQELYRSLVRFSSLTIHRNFPKIAEQNSDRDFLFMHSAYPTAEPDSVFFGPDTYRFVHFAQEALQDSHQHPFPCKRAIDLGSGSGAGGLSLQRWCDELILTDISPLALSYSKVNAHLNQNPGLEKGKTQWIQSDLFSQVPGTFDLIVANPPFLLDEGARDYRDGGGEFGAELSIRIVRESLPRLRPGGKLLLYTASAIQDGKNIFFEKTKPLLAGSTHLAFEIDPDIFGEELSRQAYSSIERIAAVGLLLIRS